MLFEDKERLDLISISLFHNLFLLFVLAPLALVGRSGESEGSPLTIIGNCVLFQVRNIKISCDFIYSTSKRNEYVWPIQLCIPQELFIPRFHNCHQEVRLDESRCSLTFVVNESLSLSLSVFGKTYGYLKSFDSSRRMMETRSKGESFLLPRNDSMFDTLVAPIFVTRESRSIDHSSRFENRACRYVPERRPSFRTKAGYVRIYYENDGQSTSK